MTEKTRSRGLGVTITAVFTAVTALLGLTILEYPLAAAWFSNYNQAQLVSGYDDDVDDTEPVKSVQLERAKVYNDALSAGAVYEPGANVPTGRAGSAATGDDYWSLLTSANGIMSRLQISSIDVDLPVYHGTDDDTLTRGIGHLQGTSLPVGGQGTHSVLTGHRGLANSTLFSNLDRLAVGDTFTLTTFGEVLTYRVRTSMVVEPDDTASLLAEEGEDLVTLVTCTPLGINSHRILVTAERVTPTPMGDIAAAEAPPTTVHFPWWAVAYVGGIAIICVYLVVTIRRDRRRGRTTDTETAI